MSRSANATRQGAAVRLTFDSPKSANESGGDTSVKLGRDMLELRQALARLNDEMDESVTTTAARRDSVNVNEAAKEMKKQRWQEAPKRALKEAMQAHGLTAEEQAQLIAEGVTTVEMFNKLPDDEFGRSGIDIAAQREEKRARDQAAEDARYADAVAAEDARYADAVATEDQRYASAVLAEEQRYAQALRQQVHRMITEQLGDGAAAASLKGAVASLAELQGMSADTIQQLGLGIGKRPSPCLKLSVSL